MANQSTEQELLAALQQSATIIQRHKKALAAYHEPIAIIGMGCHYPGGGETPDHFWQQLLAGFDAIIELPHARAMDFVGEQTPPAGFLNAVDQFDPSFFGLAPREVVVMDPAHRLLLETTWQALEAAGIVPAELLNREVGVFIGGGASGYTKFCLEQGSDLYTATGNASSAAVGRISYLLGVTGPCVAIDTACSSSLTAIHLACQSLRNGECRAAVAGGVNLLLDEDWTAMFTNGNMLSADARCKTFDAAANGYVRGEGCGILILKRLSDAQADGDNIQAVIRGTAVNQDGPSGGLTVPNGPAQERVIRLALEDARLKPEQIGYIEAHGTGTPLGDPIEIGALNAVFKARSTPLYVGSVKTNVGHLEMAAGVAGVMKLVLALQHGLIPPHLHLQTPNPHIDWAASPVQVPTTTTAWPRPADGAVRIGGVSSFGFSGTNAHIIVAEAPRADKETLVLSQAEGRRQGDKEIGGARAERPVQLFTLSAKQETALTAYAERYLDFLAPQPAIDLADLCYTTHVGRTHYAHRLTLTVDSVAALQAQLAEYVTTGEAATLSRGALVLPAAPPKVAFLFTGQGSQYVNMGRALYASEPTFRATLDRCEEVLREAFGESLLAVLYPETRDTSHETRDTHLEGTREARITNHESRITLDNTTYTQPALFVLEYALALLWQSWGIQPAILIGHSVGEVVAACVAGVFSLADGLKLIAARGRLMGALPGDGVMVSLLAADGTSAAFEAQVQQTIAPYRAEVAIAAVNGPGSIVISGERARVLALAEQLAATGVKTRQLTVSHAFHSPLMEPMLAAFAEVAQSISYHAPKVPLVSNVTGKVAGAEITTPAYWVRHVREAVRFADGVATLHEQGVAIFLEIGPKPTLLGMAAQILDQATPSQPPPAQGRSRDDFLPKLGGWEGLVVTPPLLLPSLRDGQGDWQQMLESLGSLYTHGVAIDWQALDRDAGRRKIVLPTYPFQRQRYWAATGSRRRGSAVLSPLLDKMVHLPTTHETLFETAMSAAALPFLRDHRIDETIVVPGACQLAMVLNAAALTLAPESAAGAHYLLRDIIFPQVLALTETETRTAQILLTSSAPDEAEEQARFHLHSFAAATGPAVRTTLHVQGTMQMASALPSAVTLRELQARCSAAIDVHAFAGAAESPLVFGPTFCWIEAAWHAPHKRAEVLTQLRRPAVVTDLADYPLHPGLLDACFQTPGLAPALAAQGGELLLPFAVTALQLFAGAAPAATGELWWCHAESVDENIWDLQLFDDEGQLLAAITGFTLRAMSATAISATQLPREWLHTLAWQATPLPTAPIAPTFPACWLVVGEALGLSAQLAATALPIFAASPDASVRAVVAELAAHYHSVGVIYVGIPAAAMAQMAVPVQAHQLCEGLLHLTQALLATDLAVQLWLVTQGTQQPEPTVPVTGIATGALWGLGRTVALEEPQWQTVCLDVDGSLGDVAAPHGLAERIYQEVVATLGSEQRATQVAYHQGTRYVAQVAPWQAPPVVDPAQPVRLQLQAYGSLEHLRFVPLTRRTPGPGEIEVAVKAVGVNLRDILNALGLLQEYYATVLGIDQAQNVGLGFECAGVVTAVGAGVTAFVVGERVMGLTTSAGAFASYLTLPAAQLVPIPDHLSDDDAATLPLAFLTAWYGLVELAKLQPGERVLIHAAAGGVGQAAVQIAQAIGADVIATASPGKWALLQQQGVTQLLNSRTLDFADAILQSTGGRGVDVVLNSLNGDFIERSFAALGAQGRFVEIGKLGIWAADVVAAYRPDVTYYPFDLGEALAADPSLYLRLWPAITTQLAARKLCALPKTVFPAHEVIAAFRFMQQAKQFGKVVLSFAHATPVVIRPDAAYLITGGLGALGLQVAQQLVADGARHLVLTGRRGVTTAAQRAVLAQLTDAGATVQVIEADIANAAAVQTLLDRSTALVPLRGIVHAAGVLDDGVLTAQSADRFATVMRPKVDGAWHLHTLSGGMALDFFVCFSSVAALLGAAGQSNYAAANAFLDTLMHYRRGQGLPGLSINWGPWAESGMAAGLQPQLRAQGLGLISATQGRLLFQQLLNQPVAQIGVLPLQRRQSAARMAAPTRDLQAVLRDLSAPERVRRLEEYLRKEIAAVLGLSSGAALDGRTRLFDLGMDSLMAVELRNRIGAGLRCTVRATLLFDYPTVEVLSAYLLHEVLKLPETPPEATPLHPQRQAKGYQPHAALAKAAEPVAIIGMGCHYPGAVETPAAFWQQLVAGFDGIIDWPAKRVADLPHAHLAGESVTRYTQRGGFLAQVDEFDPAFFGLSPREVLVMDPAHRLLLEIAWQALEDANLVPAQLFNQEVGVFVGGGTSGYLHDAPPPEADLYALTGNAASTAAGRLSYVLGLTGPAMAIDTACSSSLVAIHLACQSLRNGECDAALAGGVNLILEQETTTLFAGGNMLAADGRCKTFDAAADGYVRGEGCGLLVLKRLADAEAAGDPIRAVIRGSAVNQDGPSSGLTVPNGPAQVRVIRRALADAGLEPAQISYIEAHGTGTALGDPIEIGALSTVFAGRTAPLYVGSVKTNVGHLEMAAGVAGLMKLVLALQHGQIPPHLHLQMPSPYIDWAAAPLTVPTTLTEWPLPATGPADGTARIGGVSSFGFSGTNAHIIVAEAPQADRETRRQPRRVLAGGDKETLVLSAAEGGRQGAERPLQLFTLSAKQEPALVAYAERYRDFLATQPDLDLADLCYTTHVGRTHYAHRLSLTVDSVAALQAQLTEYVATREAATLSRGTLVVPAAPPKVAFLFTGQGAQYVNMGRQLYESEPSFRATLDHCEQVLRAALGESLLAVLYPETRDRRHETRDTHHESRSTLDDTTYTQPALFVLEYALALLWQSWGIQPAMLIGHSVGEVVAACVAGVFSLEDGLKLIAARGRLMGALPQDGVMVSLLAADATGSSFEAQVQQAIATYRAEVAIAAVNGPDSIVISGACARVLAIADQLAATGVKTRQLTVSHAFHSPLMEPMLAAFAAVAESISYHAPKVPLISNVTGKVAGAELTTPAYWVRHVREAVRFGDGMQTLCEQGIAIFLEIGPKPTLLGMAAQVYDQATPSQPGYPLGAAQGRSSDDSLPKLGGGEGLVVTPPLLLPSLRDGQGDWQQMFESLGNLYTQGVAIDWVAFDQGYGRRKIVLPTYPFQRQRYWVRSRQFQSQSNRQSHVMQWLHEGNVAALTQQLLTMGSLSAAEQELAPKLLALLAQQHQQQVAATADPDLTPAQWLYELNWIAADRATVDCEPSTTVTPVRAGGTWLILADRQGVGAALAQRFMANGDHAILVYPGEHCTQDAAGWQLRPLVAADFEQILHTISATTQPLQGVIHLWSLAADPSDTLSDTALAQTMLLSCGSTLTLVQTLADMALTPQLWLVTQGVQHVAATTAGLSPLHPTGGALWGLGGVIAQEQPAFECMRLDLDMGTAADAVAMLWQAINHPDQAESQVAYRQQQRYVARLQRLHLDPAAPPTIQADASYLITGGLGALGLQVAQWLVDQGARTLVLISRRATLTAADQATIQGWTAQGIAVQVLQADVADGAAVAQLLQTIASTCPPLRGIIHAAGVLDDGVLTQQQWARFERVMAPKVQGSWHLHQLTQGLPLDFFVCFSSAAAIFGSPGQGNYAAANAFMDALCHYRRQQGLPALSINWGAWAGVDGRGGMAARLGTEQQARLSATGVELIAPAQGVALLSTLLAQQDAQVVVMPVHWQQFQAQLTITPAPAFLRELLDPDDEQVQQRMGQAELRTGLLATAPNRRLAYLTTYLQEQVARILRLVEPPLPRDRFFDIGMDSLMAVELRNRLQRGTGIVLSATLFFKYPNIEELAVYFLQELTEAVPIASETDGHAPPAFWAKGAESLAQIEADGVTFDELSETEEDAEIQAALAKLAGQLAA